MMTFREYIQNHDSKRGHFMDYWRSLKNNIPIYMEPLPKEHQGLTKSKDCLRLSGDGKFIATTIARLKELMVFDNDKTKLEINFQQSKFSKRNGEPTYILWVYLQAR